jgi:hypothetical protein
MSRAARAGNRNSWRYDYKIPAAARVRFIAGMSPTTGSESRLNFLEPVRAGYNDYVINAEALAYMRERALPAYVIIA